MLPEKERKAFIKIIDTLKPNADIVKFAKPISEFLVKQGVDDPALKNINFKPWFIKVFEELADKSQVWLPADKLEKLLTTFPDNWKREMLSDEIVKYHIPEAHWNKYRDSKWIKENPLNKTKTAATEAELKTEIMKF